MKKIKDILIEESEKSITQEICGFICLGENFYFKEVKNRASDPNVYFHMSTIDFLSIKNNNKIISIFHNHPNNIENQSSFDKNIADNICLPSIVYSNMTKKFSIFIPDSIDSDVKDVERLKEEIFDD